MHQLQSSRARGGDRGGDHVPARAPLQGLQCPTAAAADRSTNDQGWEEEGQEAQEWLGQRRLRRAGPA